MTGGAEVVDVVSIIVLKDDVIDHPVNLRRRHATRITRHVAQAAGPRIRHAAVIAGKSCRICNHTDTPDCQYSRLYTSPLRGDYDTT